MSTNKIGRNDLCPCGSGKKYKQCCQANQVNRSASAIPPAAVQHAFRSAVMHHGAGRWQMAETVCQQILQMSPNQPEALGLLGVIALQDGNTAVALEFLKKAVKFRPNNAELHGNLGFAHHEAGNIEQANQHYRLATHLMANHANAHYNFHALLVDKEDWQEAKKHLERVLTLNPRDNDARYMLGVLLDYLSEREAAANILLPLASGNSRDIARLDAWTYLKAANPPPTICGSILRIFERAFKAAPAQGLVLEFGVRHGNTIRQIAGLAQQPVHGFDSFEGLPEAWHHESKGSYSTRGILPTVPKNVTLHAGWFENTLPKFLQQHDGPVRLLNIDCDIYSSTKTVLDHLASRIVPGSVIIFDEYIGNEHWREDEYKAFQEAVARYGWRYEYLCFSVFTKQVAVRITAVD